MPCPQLTEALSNKSGIEPSVPRWHLCWILPPGLMGWPVEQASGTWALQLLPTPANKTSLRTTQ